MAETTVDQSERWEIGPYGLPVHHGIICPWNKTDQGPAKRRLQCMIWKASEKLGTKTGYETHAKLEPESGRFCRVICKYGKMYAQQRTQVERSASSFRFSKLAQIKYEAWHERLKEWWQRQDWMPSKRF